MNKSRHFQFSGSPIEAAMLFAIFLILLFAAFTVRADNQSFGVTNQIYTGVNLISAPGFGSLGNAIDITGYNDVGVTVSGRMSTTNTGTLTVVLTRSDANSVPGTNDWDWSASLDTSGRLNQNGTVGAIVLTIPNGVVTNSAGTLTNTFINWHTNLDITWTRPANYLGVYNLTNNAAAGIFTNLAAAGGTNLGASPIVKVNKKIMPFRFPN